MVYALISIISSLATSKVRRLSIFFTAALAGCNGMTSIHGVDAAGALDKLADYIKEPVIIDK